MSLQIVAQRMKSVGNIQKITAAMKMVAASRLKGAQTKMEKSRGIVQPLFRMLGDQPGIEAEKTMVVPVSSDKGLCGGINTTRKPRTNHIPLFPQCGGQKPRHTGSKG